MAERSGIEFSPDSSNAVMCTISCWPFRIARCDGRRILYHVPHSDLLHLMPCRIAETPGTGIASSCRLACFTSQVLHPGTCILDRRRSHISQWLQRSKHHHHLRIDDDRNSSRHVRLRHLSRPDRSPLPPASRSVFASISQPSSIHARH